MKEQNRQRILSFIVISYMLMALLWWAVLLYRKNSEVYLLKTQLLKEEYLHKAGFEKKDLIVFPEFEQLTANYNRQMYMILGEALVFAITLILGIYFINRAYVRELSAAEKQKNFLLSITHELKSPLASINLILSTFIKRKLPHEKIAELSEDGIKESSRLEELFNKILISTRLGQAYTYHFEPCNLSHIIAQTATNFQKIHPEAIVMLHIQPDVIREVEEESIVSVVKNLLENAIKYSPDEKRIDLNLSKIQDKIEFTIADRGIGISKTEKAKVFDQFYRVGSEDTRKTKGTGLGLYIVKRIVEGHKGKIKIQDNPGGGTKFIITL